MIAECNHMAGSLPANLSAIRSFDDACNQVRAYVGAPTQIGWVRFDTIAEALLERARRSRLKPQAR